MLDHVFHPVFGPEGQIQRSTYNKTTSPPLPSEQNIIIASKNITIDKLLFS
jgi:hypothetical protein